MKPTPLDYEIAKLIDQEGIDKVLAALCREANDRGNVLLFRRLNSTYDWCAVHDQTTHRLLVRRVSPVQEQRAHHHGQPPDDLMGK